MRIDGTCHCGNVSFAFETQRTIETLDPRACDCEFCTRHAAVCVSDPLGRVTISVKDEEWLQRYRYGAATADFLICRRCGVYLGAVIAQNDAGPGPIAEDTLRATVNLRSTELRGLAGAAVSYEGETRDERIARRLARWTPARLQVKA